MSASSHTVHLHGAPLSLVGRLIRVGDRLPEMSLLTPDLKPMALHSLQGQWSVVSTLPSLDTPVCSAQAAAVEQHAQDTALPLQWVILSEDLPFAQKRWVQEHACRHMVVLSDAHSHQFARETGLWIDTLGVLARAILLVDPQGFVREVSISNELSEEPDYAPILAHLQEMCSGAT